MNGILQEGQAISYLLRRPRESEEREISRITSEVDLPPGLEGQLRDYQPFLDVSTRYVVVPSNNGKKALVVDNSGNVEWHEDSITLLTSKGTLRIQYVRIDLTKVLTDGPFHGVNRGDGGLMPRPFPYP